MGATAVAKATESLDPVRCRASALTTGHDAIAERQAMPVTRARAGAWPTSSAARVQKGRGRAPNSQDALLAGGPATACSRSTKVFAAFGTPRYDRILSGDAAARKGERRTWRQARAAVRTPKRDVAARPESGGAMLPRQLARAASARPLRRWAATVVGSGRVRNPDHTKHAGASSIRACSAGLGSRRHSAAAESWRCHRSPWMHSGVTERSPQP
jgi:hypothetical protein